MNEQDFSRLYAELMDEKQPSDELIERTRARARAIAPCPQMRDRHRWRPSKASSIAACLVAGALLVGGVGYTAAVAGGLAPSPFATSAPSDRNGFAVRAWASDGGTILPTEDGKLVLDRTHAQWTQTDSGNPGYFTGCTFTVEGEGITRAQAAISSGELYRQDAIEISQDTDPVAFNRATNWDDRFRGLSGTLESCDSVVITSWDAPEGGDLNGEEEAGGRTIQAATLKRYGAVIDLSAADDAGIANGTTSFGLFNPDVEGDPVALFDGASLTVTATFEDGTTSTRVIVLHEAMFRVTPRYEDNPTYFDMTSEITSLDVDGTAPEMRGGAPVAGNDGTYSIASVYGEVVSDTDEPFPATDKVANEFANTLMRNGVDGVELANETEPLREGETFAVAGGGDVARAIKPLVESEAAGDEAHKGNRGGTTECDSVVVHAPVVTFSDTPPLGRTKSEFAYLQGFRGDGAYADKWLLERFGMAFNDDGTLATEGFTFATITLGIENTGDADEDFIANRETLAQLAVVGDDGSVSRIARTSYTLVEEVDAPSHSDASAGTCYTASAKSRITCTFAYAIPSHFVAEGNLYVDVNGTLFPANA